MKHLDRQTGVTLVETMIGLALSMIVVSSMVSLMSNSMGSATRIIQMSQLTDELRNTMSMMSRDVRRANFNPNSIYCYANSKCGSDGSATQSSDITINGDENCMLFNLDRNWDGVANTDAAGGFALDTSGAVGVIKMWVGDASPSCATAQVANNADWIEVTDPGFVNITEFELDRDGQFESNVESGTGTLTQRTRVIRMQIRGELILDTTINRRIEDTVKVRNDFYL